MTLFAACKSWLCWSYTCGFISMAFPKILFISAFLLLLSFWVDIFHHSDEDEEDEGWSPQEALLLKTTKFDSIANCLRECCFFRTTNIGRWQKVVILVTLLTFAITIVSAALIWTEMGKNSINSKVVAQVYVDLLAIAVVFLGGALACYGLLLFKKMRKVRSDRATCEKCKFVGLAVVSIVSFTSSAYVAIATNIPLIYHWRQQDIDGVHTPLLLVLYYLIGSSLPSAFVLCGMRELPAFVETDRQEQWLTIAFIDDDDSVAADPQPSTADGSMQIQESTASPT
ncbi:tobamovirus multiplication 1-like isoform X1 [Olea europaea subsp. europaea]|nr:tobamovirus multiplication 1-like isoform X1 [Olea europaea subsp. europaea]